MARLPAETTRTVTTAEEETAVLERERLEQLVDASAVKARRRRPTVGTFLIVLLLVALAGGLAAVTLIERNARHSSTAQLHRELNNQARQLTVLQAQDATLAHRLAKLQGSLARQGEGYAPLAARILRSVYTVDSGQELGTAWVAWKSKGFAYLITANHVVADAVSLGDRNVRLKQKNLDLAGTVLKQDTTNDLAVIRTKSNVGPALWQTPQLDVSPLPGDALLLVGSPYGLEGTVTQGVVSRVTYDQIQTDAAANPGNSGGPAVDREGRVVGILLAGGAQNLNFAVPIQRACVVVRSCA